MFKVLFMPLLQIPSGHHHVADSIKEQLHQSSGRYYCEKLEILSHCYGKVEAFISTVYLQWIHKLPQIYSRIYKTAAVKGSSKRYYTYEWLFLKKVHRAIEHTNPDLIICTHALPSYLLERLKKNGLWSGPVINVYTDYFINDLWGREHIDYHFVPSLDVKQKLLMRGANRSQIFVTGIPVHPIFKRTKNKSKNEDRLIILISGGNMGAGAIQQLLNRLKPSGSILYKVLCGKNDLLFQSIERLQYSHIKALPYLDSKGEMNQLYDEADAIITKPGGVTITECLWKKLPIFIYEALPGQEEFNLHYLKNEGLIFHLDNRHPLNSVEDIIIHTLKKDLLTFKKRLDTFYNDLEKSDISTIIGKILVP